MIDLDLTPCLHKRFKSVVRVARATEDGGFVAEIIIACADRCEARFTFPGISTVVTGALQPVVSPDGTELRVVISPEPAATIPIRES